MKTVICEYESIDKHPNTVTRDTRGRGLMFAGVDGIERTYWWRDHPANGMQRIKH